MSLSSLYRRPYYLSIKNIVDKPIMESYNKISLIRVGIAMEQKKKPAKTTTNIQIALKKATTEMMVLVLLRERPMYTYEMMAAIQERSGGVITFNTMYLSIYRLQDRGYIREQEKAVSPDNRVRIYFAITDSGRSYLKELLREYRQFTAALDGIIDGA